ncbi:L,D-transpeptidase family protein [Microbacterium jejuense]|uniref:L,D-transpeptidase family protein n=1 Tax=Microbacterium jejuense TaxID=1263637 RepID=A0ABS7HRX7_9MICO|nr:L,D-transpeptidase [Microbacterium jejuense]MBW9095110.1 L,D-transpeptidase family protein [Microbacterium jejuense]
MTDLATQRQADKASAGDGAEVEEAVDDATDQELEGSPADESAVDAEPTDEAADAADGDGEAADGDAEAEDADAPADGDGEPEDAAEVADAADSSDAGVDAPEQTDEVEADVAEPEEADAVDDGEPTEPGASDEVVEPEAGDEVVEPEADHPDPDETVATTGEATAPEEPVADTAGERADSEDADPAGSAPAAAGADDIDAAPAASAATAVLAPVADPVAPQDADATTVLPDLAAPASAAPPAGTDGVVYAWAEPAPKPKKKRTALWVGIGAGVAAVALVASSLLLIAPGTTVAGVPVGWMTPGAAAAAIEQRLAETTVVLTGEGGDAELTGAELGASVDGQALADAAFGEHPMWNVTSWFAETGAEVELDAAVAVEALRDAAPDLFTDPVDATVSYDAATASYVSTPAEAGSGIDLSTVQQALQAAFEAGKTSVDVEAVVGEVPATISTETAADTATKLNGVLANVGFYVGDERTVPVDPAVAASWITLDEGDDGSIIIDVDEQKIQSVVDTLPGLVNRDAVNATVVTNSAGKVLGNPVSAGAEGRTLESTDGIAAAFAEQIAGGDGAYELKVTATPFTTTNLARRIDVNLSTQRATLFENDQVVQTFVVSSGAANTRTPTGNFTVYAYTRITDMGALCYNPNAVNSYCTEDVPWVTWFYPDIAFHGASAFRSALGFPQSHGCVNMWDDAAKYIYEWSRVGTEVSVHY